MKLILTKAISCLFLITAFTLTANAQKKSDYVITTAGDSLPCVVKLPFFNNGKSKYKTSAMNEFVKAEPDQVKEFSANHGESIFASAYLPGEKKPIFVEVIEKGKIYLYQVINSYQTYYNNTTTFNSTQNWYISKGSDKIQSLKTSGIMFGDKSRKERIDYFSEMIKDNSVVYNKYLANKKFSFKELRILIHLYNTGTILAEENDDN